MQEFNKQFDDIVTFSLFNSASIPLEYLEILDEIAKKLEESKDVIGDINTLKANSSQENRYMYDELISRIISKSNLKYEQVINSLTDPKFMFIIFNKLNSEQFVKYLIHENINMELINDYINNHDINIKELAKYINKFPDGSLDMPYSKSIFKFISINLLRKFSKNFVTKYLLDNYKDFNKFIDVLDNNDFLLSRINGFSLVFSDKYQKDVIAYINKYPKSCSLFHPKYFDKLQIEKIYKKGIINSVILGKMIELGVNPKEVYTKSNIIKCSDNSIDYPIDLLGIDINDYNLLNKFNEYRIVEYLNNITEEDRISLLRNTDFLNSMSDYTIQLLVNNLSFKSLFNMIQNKEIFNKVNNINAKIYERDKAFIKGYLDSLLLVSKSNHSMIYNLLNQLNPIDDYLFLPYIYTKLTNSEIVDLLINKNNNLKEIIDNDNLFNKLDSTSLANLINSKKGIDFLELVSNKKVLKKLFNISDVVLDSVDLQEVNYLFETIRTKDVLSIQDKNYTVLTYRAVLAMYLTFGIRDSIDIIVRGNKDLDITKIKEEIRNITYNNLFEYRNDNYNLLQNIDKKIVYNLKDADVTTIEAFKEFVANNGYLRGIINLMVSTGFATVTELTNMFYNYKLYEDNYEQRKELSNFCNSFSLFLINKKRIQFSSKLEATAKKQTKLKDSVSNKEYKQKSEEVIKRIKLRIFIETLQSEDKLKYFYAYRDDFDVFDIKNKYMKYLSMEEFDLESIINYILRPLSKDKFDKIECLQQLGFAKPKDYDLYIRTISDINTVNEINSFISSLDYSDDIMIEILNAICYGSPIPKSVSEKTKHSILKLYYKAYEILGEIYIDKTNLKVIYSNTIDIDNEDTIIDYLKNIDIIDEIIEKTFNYLNRHMVKEKIKNNNILDLIHSVKIDESKYSFNEKNFEINKRLFSLKDVERIFNGFSFDSIPVINDNLKNLLFDRNLIAYVGIGLYDKEVDNLGYIISNWSKIEDACQDLNLDITTLDIFDILKVVINMNYDYSKNIPSLLTMYTYSDTYYYDVPGIQERLDIISKTIAESQLKLGSSIPMLGVSNDDYSLSVLDYQDPSNYLLSFDTDYRIGSSNSDSLVYSVLSENATTLVIKDKDNNIIGRINGVRNGNTLFLATPVLSKDINITDLLLEFSRNIVLYTSDSHEPIEIVTICNYDYGIRIDSSTCSYINTPIDFNSSEYNRIYNKNLLLSQDINKNFNGSISVLYSSKTIDRNSFSSYEPSIRYDRIRSNILLIEGMINEECIEKINAIINRYNTINNINKYHELDLDAYKTIYLSSDYVILVSHNNEIDSYILPYDKRAIDEVNNILETLSQNKKTL